MPPGSGRPRVHTFLPASIVSVFGILAFLVLEFRTSGSTLIGIESRDVDPQ